MRSRERERHEKKLHNKAPATSQHACTCISDDHTEPVCRTNCSHRLDSSSFISLCATDTYFFCPKTRLTRDASTHSEITFFFFGTVNYIGFTFVTDLCYQFSDNFNFPCIMLHYWAFACDLWSWYIELLSINIFFLSEFRLRKESEAHNWSFVFHHFFFSHF